VPFAALPPVTRSWTEDGLLGVCLPAGRGDALLTAALAGGCSAVPVLGVLGHVACAAAGTAVGLLCAPGRPLGGLVVLPGGHGGSS
jgi:hypothetical protein